MSAKIKTDQYFAALARLVARGTTINNDAVALEAGKGRGSIKLSRPAHAELVKAIEAAAAAQAEKARAKIGEDPLPGLRAKVELLSQRIDQSLDRELALLHEAIELRATVRQLTEENRQLKLGRLVAVK